MKSHLKQLYKVSKFLNEGQNETINQFYSTLTT